MSADLDLIRRAANQMRELAEVVIPGPWEAGEHCIWALSNSPSLIYTIVSDGEAGDGGVTDEDTTAYLAAWHPAVALTVADWLDLLGGWIDEGVGLLPNTNVADAWSDMQVAALAVARAFLKEDA
ncbi:hypothetical protein [Pimelobacter simplex]|uniref:hypothetical protein n=1 Tax=Nocardioides simplex TaxID=2045 RepID=UPI003AAE15EF